FAFFLILAAREDLKDIGALAYRITIIIQTVPFNCLSWSPETLQERLSNNRLAKRAHQFSGNGVYLHIYVQDIVAVMLEMNICFIGEGIRPVQWSVDDQILVCFVLYYKA